MSTRRQIGSHRGIDPVGPGHLVADKYELIEVAGVGGMATVWRAVQRGPGRFRRLVAVKQMHPHLAAQAQYREMFFEEARVGGVLSDPNLAQIQDFIEIGQQLYLVMEWVEGIDLATYSRYAVATSQTTRWELVSAVGIGMLRGLAAAHEHTGEDGKPAPVLHRDVSPHNVLISVKGPARLIDFGLALATDRAMAPTPPGTAKGKLAYLSPEVARGEPPTPAADQFAAGSVLWEALVGRKLFDGDDEAEVFRKLATADVEPLARHRPDVPRTLSRVIARALEADPANRFPSARAMALELGQVLRAAGSQIDLYALLSRTVVDARAALDMGGRTQAPVPGGEIPEEESEIVPLLLRSAWRKVRSRIPFLGGVEPRQRKRTVGGAGIERTPTSDIRRANAQGVLRLAEGDDAETDGLWLRLAHAPGEKTPSDPHVELEVTHAGATERLALELPGQLVYLGYLITGLSRDGGVVSLRISRIRVGVSLLVFPYVPILIGELTFEVTGVGDSRVFLSLRRDDQPAEHLIVAATNHVPGIVMRAGYRITIEGLSPPWVTVRIDEVDESDELELELVDDDIVEV